MYITPLEENLARRLYRKSVTAMVVAACLWVVVVAPAEPLWSVRWWLSLFIGSVLTVVVLAAIGDFRYARRVLADQLDGGEEGHPTG